MDYQKVQIGNVNLLLIKTNKFKTTTISYRLTSNIEEKNIENRVLLPHVLAAKSSRFQSRIAVGRHLEELYGSSFFVNTRHYGNHSVIDFQLKMVNNKFLAEEKLFSLGMQFLKELITKPFVNNKSFDKKIVEEEKRLQIDFLEGEKDNKVRYTFNKLISKMCAGEIISFDKDGKIENIKNIDEKSLFLYYEEILKTNVLDLVVSGDFEFGEMLEIIKKDIISWQVLYQKDYPFTKYKKEILEQKLFKENDKFKQTTLIIGYRTNTFIGERMQYPLLLANAILGSYMNSRLFKTVREKNSLAYSVYSFINNLAGTMFIVAGIDLKNLDETINLIDAEVKLLAEEITNKELEVIKRQVINDITEIEDSQSATLERIYNALSLEISADLEETIEKVKNVTKEAIKEAAALIIKDTTFVLAGVQK